RRGRAGQDVHQTAHLLDERGLRFRDGQRAHGLLEVRVARAAHHEARLSVLAGLLRLGPEPRPVALARRVRVGGQRVGPRARGAAGAVRGDLAEVAGLALDEPHPRAVAALAILTLVQEVDPRHLVEVAVLAGHDEAHRHGRVRLAAVAGVLPAIAPER